MALSPITSKFTIKTIATGAGILVALLSIIGGIIQGMDWADERYITTEELALILETMSNTITSDLQTINENLIVIGNSVFDQRISDTKDNINELKQLEELNDNEKEFLSILKQDLLDLSRLQKKLQETKIEPIGD